MENIVYKNDQKYIKVLHPIQLKWSKLLFIKDMILKGANVYTKKGTFRKSFLPQINHDNVIPYLRIVMASHDPKIFSGPSAYVKFNLTSIDRKIDLQNWTHQGGKDLEGRWSNVSWINNYKRYFKGGGQHQIYCDSFNKLYIRVD